VNETRLKEKCKENSKEIKSQGNYYERNVIERKRENNRES
jgi:hypothetical protein